MVQAKSVHGPIDKSKDGLRILAARFRGRGLPKDRYDVWMPNLGPSQELLHDFQTAKITWTQFSRRYRNELFDSSTIDKRNPLIKNHGQKFTLRLLQQLAKQGRVTVMCHCDEAEPHCHRHLLQKVLNSHI